MDGAQLGNLIVLLAVLAVLPFVLVMVTSFAKLVVVLSLLRQALGTQQVPPNTVITGLALILTLHVMYPTVLQIRSAYEDAAPTDVLGAGFGEAERMIAAAEGPMSEFLIQNSSPRHRLLFERMRDRREAEIDLGSEDAPLADLEPQIQRAIETITVTAPAFVLTELTEAFQIAFLIFIPFLVIDLVVSNILLAMGMHMMSPVTVSTPIKLLLFVVVAGWEILVEGLVLGYT
ncbi:MAG: EscR/YscR/HrcR family type III secretion system export apparatus protein [Phycisphaerales bacterium]|nr:EscR/YscR/HrcR family type III secretion system export apparatus protein [Phycisphaerales bacterium]